MNQLNAMTSKLIYYSQIAKYCCFICIPPNLNQNQNCDKSQWLDVEEAQNHIKSTELLVLINQNMNTTHGLIVKKDEKGTMSETYY